MSEMPEGTSDMPEVAEAANESQAPAAREPEAPTDVQWREPGTGAPEGLSRTLRMLAERLGADSLDRLWLFPPRVRGRKESGLVAASRFHPDSPERRFLFTAPYTSERTGQGTTVESSLNEEGEAPPDRLPRVMDGVVRRSGDEPGVPREVEIGGDALRLNELIEELERA